MAIELESGRKEKLLARLDKRVERVAEILRGYEKHLTETKAGSATSRAGAVRLTTRYSAQDVVEAQKEVEARRSQIADWKLIRDIVKEAC